MNMIQAYNIRKCNEWCQKQCNWCQASNLLIL